MGIADRRKLHSATLISSVKLIVAAILCWSLSGTALADRDHGGHSHDRGYGHPRGNPHWHGSYRPYYRDYRHWHDGYWYHGYRGGRFGWWWNTGGFWYPYAQPVYPYPEPYQPPVIYQQRGDVDNDIDSAQPEPESTAAPTQIWYYYCRSTKSYFPYVSSCAEGWQEVPATPENRPSDLPDDRPDDAAEQ
jgi:hypothetical protein